MKRRFVLLYPLMLVIILSVAMLHVGDGRAGVMPSDSATPEREAFLPFILKQPTPTLTPTSMPTGAPTATPEDCAPPNLQLPIKTHSNVASSPSPFVLLFEYGKHYPNGEAAVDYIYSSSGMWRKMNPAEYRWNYYCYPDNPPNHPYDRDRLIKYADGSHFTTTLDANRHLLLDWNHDGEIDTAEGGFAFHEHNGKGVRGQSVEKPFTNFWFDDNWLARYMSEAYDRPQPNGLSDYSDFMRWKIIGGNAANWTPYPDDGDHIDRLALNGLYYLAINNVDNAIQEWVRIRDISGYVYDGVNQRYDYATVNENYHLGLFEILTSFLLDHPSISSSKRHELLQHWISLRSNILSNQETDGTQLYGWRTHINDLGTLMNTETIAANVLALGSGAIHVFEAGKPPLQMNNNNYFPRPHNVLSAVTGLSQPGHMTFGPYWNYPPGSYQVDFFLRSPSPIGKMATIDVYDAQSGQMLAVQDVWASDMVNGNEWSRFTLDVDLANSNNRLEFRTYWHGAANMDIASIRIRHR